MPANPALGRAVRATISSRASQPQLHPMAVPGIGLRLHRRRNRPQLLDHSGLARGWTSQAMAKASSAPGPEIGVPRQQGRLGMGFLQPFDDGQRLGDHPRLCLQHRHQPWGFSRWNSWLCCSPLSGCRHALDGDPLQRQGDPHAIGGGGRKYPCRRIARIPILSFCQGRQYYPGLAGHRSIERGRLL